MKNLFKKLKIIELFFEKINFDARIFKPKLSDFLRRDVLRS